MGVAPKRAIVLVALLGLSACDQAPREVYVPESEPQVELAVRASALEVSVGEPVVLHAERWSRGEWKLVEKRELDSGQCWLRHPPESHEEEVADNLRWEATPSTGVRFNKTPRSDRSRSAVFEQPGRFVLHSSSRIWCRPGKQAEGRPIEILVRDDNDRTSIPGQDH
jgi:hypothetical protein